MAGDFFREAVFAAPGADFLAARAFGLAEAAWRLGDDWCFDWAPLVALAAGDLEPVRDLLFAADVAAAFLVVAFAVDFFAAGLLPDTFFADADATAARLAFGTPALFALGFLDALLRGAVAVPLGAVLTAALARVPVDFVDAAMICLWFLTLGRARELLTPGNSKGA